MQFARARHFCIIINVDCMNTQMPSRGGCQRWASLLDKIGFPPPRKCSHILTFYKTQTFLRFPFLKCGHQLVFIKYICLCIGFQKKKVGWGDVQIYFFWQKKRFLIAILIFIFPSFSSSNSNHATYTKINTEVLVLEIYRILK